MLCFKIYGTIVPKFGSRTSGRRIGNSDVDDTVPFVCYIRILFL
jgi:hypothetical protein